MASVSGDEASVATAVARHPSQGGALHAAGIHLLDPAIRERLRRAGVVPLKFAIQIVQADLQPSRLRRFG
jgi:hypothetical protein